MNKTYPGEVERFMAKIHVDENGCWRWTARIDGKGYAQFSSRRDDGSFRTERAHRFACRAMKEPLADGMVIDHLCRTRDCVNPEHLEQVPSQTNTLRGVGFGAVNAAKTHCLKGHEYTPENTVKLRHGRECRECKKQRKRASRAKAIRQPLPPQGEG